MQSTRPSDFLSLKKSGKLIDHSEAMIDVYRDFNVAYQAWVLPADAGTSTFLSMLHYFFSPIVNRKDTAHLFTDLAISRHKHYKQHQGQYNVMFLDWSDLKTDNFAHFLTVFRKKMADLYQEYEFIYEFLDDDDKKDFSTILQDGEETKQVDQQVALANLIKNYIPHYRANVLSERNLPERSLVLIDGYDEFAKASYDTTAASHFLKSVLINLKGIPYLNLIVAGQKKLMDTLYYIPVMAPPKWGRHFETRASKQSTRHLPDFSMFSTSLDSDNNNDNDFENVGLDSSSDSENDNKKQSKQTNSESTKKSTETKESEIKCGFCLSM